MKPSISLLLCAVCLVAVTGQEKFNFKLNQPQPPKIGQPQFSLQGAGGGKNFRNFGAAFNAGVGTKVWESKNKHRSLDLGVNYGRAFQRINGQTFKSPPSYGAGATFRFGKKK